MPAVLSEQPLMMNEDEAAAYLGVKPGTLAVWRCTRRHDVPYHKVGRLVRYRRDDLDQWLEERRHSGGEAGE